MILAALSDVRKRWLLIATLGAAGAGVAAGFAFTAAKRYEATAVVVVAPAAPSDPTLLGIDVLHDTNRRAAAATAARLIAAPEIAEAVRVRLGLRESRTQILKSIRAHPDGRSDAVDVVATASDPGRAAQLANAFVDAFITRRTAGYQSEVASAVRRVQARLVALPPNRRVSPEGVQLQRRLGDLRALIGTSDPTVRHGSEAVAPASASWPHPVRWTILGALIGLGAGALVALLLGAIAASRREESADGEGYDPRVPERIVARLEQRLAERVEALAAEQQRLANREASLAVREREVAAKLDELRAAVATSEPAAPSNTLLLEREEELARREEALQERVRGLTERERGLARRAAELESRERERAEAPEPAAPSNSLLLEREEELARREEALEERVRTLSERERALARESAELRRLEARIREAEENVAHRAQDVTAREAELAEIPAPAPPPLTPAEPAPAPMSAAAPAAPPAPAPVPSGPGRLLGELERLVAANAAENPDRVEEWQSYLFYLRDYADVDGRVPAQFEWLIEDTFGDLLAASR